MSCTQLYDNKPWSRGSIDPNSDKSVHAEYKSRAKQQALHYLSSGAGNAQVHLSLTPLPSDTCALQAHAQAQALGAPGTREGFCVGELIRNDTPIRDMFDSLSPVTAASPVPIAPLFPSG